MIIEGIPSGDLECWCFLVDRETFKRVTGEYPQEPEKDANGYEMLWDVGRFAKENSPYRYMIYPHHLVGFDNRDKLVRISIEVQEG